MNVTVVGPDANGIVGALEGEGHQVAAAPVGNRPGLEEAGIHDAAVYLLTDVEQATSIAVAKDLNEGVRVVVYAEGSLPDFARRQADLLVDPDLLGPEAVAEELS
ncbi:CTP synthetase [Halobacteriales archaeon QS_1_68_17]|nr:MAG: CTP synthetase [Halobacteriales archaeon QS_1_68_17]